MRVYIYLMVSTDPHTEKEQDLMPIVVDFPPNFQVIKNALPLAGKAHTYSYGGTIYNPSGAHLSIDRQYHEFIHMEQQKECGDGDQWWNRYLVDESFRLDQEIEAYGKQYAFVRDALIAEDEKARSEGKRLGGGVNNTLKMIIGNMAQALSGPEYGNLLSFGAAESAIKKYGKK